MSIRIKRVIAFVIDWNITLFPFVFIFSFLTTFLHQYSSINPLIVFLCFLLIISAFVAFVLRDTIFKSRSLGKRIFGLYIYDKNSLKQASVKQRFLRNIFFFLYFIDGILLLSTGKTIGDRVAGTLVMSKQGHETYLEEIQINPPVPKKKKVKKIALVLAIIIGCLVALMGLLQVAINAQKDTEEYKIAYSYFVESQAFKELNVDESKIRFNKYSSYTYTSADNESISETVEIGFVVKFKSFEIICHKENSVWEVCEECTVFK